jgi:hypothetical protein
VARQVSAAVSWKSAFLVVLLLLPSGASAAGPPPVTYAAPAGWLALPEIHDKDARIAFWVVPNEHAPVPPFPSTAATVVIQPVPADWSLEKAMSAARSRMAQVDATEVLHVEDGPSWVSLMFTGRKEAARMVYLYRVGIGEGVMVEALLTFPLPPAAGQPTSASYLLTLKGPQPAARPAGIAGDPELLKPMADQFNSLVRSLRIGGRNSARVEAVFVEQRSRAPSRLRPDP